MINAYLTDSNILLRISRRDDPDYRIVHAALERLLGAEAALYYTHQNIAEFWNVWTRARRTKTASASRAQPPNWK